MMSYAMMKNDAVQFLNNALFGVHRNGQCIKMNYVMEAQFYKGVRPEFFY